MHTKLGSKVFCGDPAMVQVVFLKLSNPCLEGQGFVDIGAGPVSRVRHGRGWYQKSRFWGPRSANV